MSILGGVDIHSILLDNVSYPAVYAVPEPRTDALIALGLGLLGLAGSQRVGA